MQNQTHNIQDPLVNSADVKRALGGISDVTLWRRVKNGRLPNPLIHCGRKYWPKSAIDSAMKQSEERPQQSAAFKSESDRRQAQAHAAAV